jgi:hypothetical protein
VIVPVAPKLGMERVALHLATADKETALLGDGERTGWQRFRGVSRREKISRNNEGKDQALQHGRFLDVIVFENVTSALL